MFLIKNIFHLLMTQINCELNQNSTQPPKHAPSLWRFDTKQGDLKRLTRHVKALFSIPGHSDPFPRPERRFSQMSQMAESHKAPCRSWQSASQRRSESFGGVWGDVEVREEAIKQENWELSDDRRQDLKAEKVWRAVYFNWLLILLFMTDDILFNEAYMLHVLHNDSHRESLS